MEIKPCITVKLEQSKRDAGAVTKNAVKYDEIGGGAAVRNIYVNQLELRRAFGKFPQGITITISETEAA